LQSYIKKNKQPNF